MPTSPKKRKKEKPSPPGSLRDLAVVYLCGEVNNDMAKHVVTEMLVLTSLLQKKRRKKDKLITLMINTEGGDVFSGLDIMTSIRIAQQRGIEVHGIVGGHAESMGYFILQACDKRAMSSEAILMVHGVTHGLEVDNTGFRAEKELIDHLTSQFADLLERRTKLPTPKITKILDAIHHHYFNVEDALYWGMIDEVVA